MRKGQAVEQPAQFPAGDLARAGAVIWWPPEPAPLQAPVVQPEAIMLPVQDLQLVAFPVAEDEQGRRKGVQVEPLLHQDSEAVDGLTHVGAATGKVDPGYLNLA